MLRGWKLAGLVSFFAASFLFAQSETAPRLLHYVTDQAGILSESQKESLDSSLRAFEDATSNQVVVFITPSLQGEEIRQYALRIAEQNQVGQKKKNNGVVLVIAKEDRKMSIEVGYGLEGVLPDALCDQIIRNNIRPYFRQGDFYGGVSAGIDAIIAATKGEYKADRARTHGRDWGSILFIVLFLIFGFGPWLVTQFLRGFVVGSSDPKKRPRDGFWGGGFFGGGGGWSGGGGGGFSGGGGSFGGGGASGSW